MSFVLPDCAPLLCWYRENRRDLPWRKTRDPYRIWVSEIMLQQTRVETVLPYYERFLSTLPDIAALADAPEEQLLKLWEGLGYYSRVRNMQRAARTVIQEHKGTFPHTFEDIRRLCGIGDYTAGAIASFAFGLPYPAVDGNVLRVAARLTRCADDILSPRTRKELTAAVAAAQPADAPAEFNQAIMELGALVCVPNGVPSCARCPFRLSCLAHAAGTETALPVRRKPAPRKKEARTVLIIRSEDRVALCRRPGSGLLANLFEPFCLPGLLTAKEVQAALHAQGIDPERISPLGEARHIFTHLEWQMTGYEVLISECDTEKLPEEFVLYPRETVDSEVALPSAYSAYRPFL